MFGQGGVFCPIYNEEIFDEVAGAKDCPMYDPVGSGTEEAEIIGLTDRRRKV